MKVLITGAFGNIGAGTVTELLKRGHRVRCFDVPSKDGARTAARLDRRAEVVWGDLRRPADVARAVAGVDVVIHLAFVIPKLSLTGVSCEDQPDWAWEINVGGTTNLLEAMKSQARPPRLIFASSLHIYGITRDEPPPRRVTDPVRPLENYARHKVICEGLVRDSGLEWSIFRFAAALPFSLKLDGALFEIPLDNRMEYVHNRDVGFALAQAVRRREIWGKVLHIGGGPRCWYTYGEMVQKVLAAAGVDMLPAEAFSRTPFSTDWIDTEESQRLLKYQRHTLDDYARELARRLGARRYLAMASRPLVRALLLRHSAYYLARRFARERAAMRGRLAVVTCGANSFGQAIARKLAQEGMRVVLVACLDEDLQPLLYQIGQEGGQAQALTADLSDPAEAVRLYGELRQRFGPPDVLVGYADLVWISGAGELDSTAMWRRLEANLLGELRLGELVAEEMRRSGSGHLVYLEPALKLFPVQPAALLRAARSFFRTYVRRLRRELRDSPVRVSLIQAGIPTTELLSIRRLLHVVTRRRYGVEVRPELMANRIWLLLVRPRPVVYVPQRVAFFSWLETYAGWVVELIRRHLLPRGTRVRS